MYLSVVFSSGETCSVSEAQHVFVQIKFDNVNHNGQMTVDLVLSDKVLTCHGDIITGDTQ